MGTEHNGSCFCGAVTFTVSGEPNIMGYCHCTDCAAWAGAPVNAFSLWAPDAVKITAGADKIGSFAKTPASHRKFCTDCGGHLMSEHPGMGMTDVYLNVVEGMDHAGTMHIYYGEKTLSVKDGLPKYNDLPADFGGSGDTLAE